MKISTTVSTEVFCNCLANAVHENGKGVIPLVGAGLSASAGIPTSDELLLYLKLCVAMALGLIDENEGFPTGECWHPAIRPWPQMRGNWVRLANEGQYRINAVNTLKVERDRSGKAQAFQQLCRTAWGALTDWRTSLQFLARIEPNPHKAEKDAEPLGAPFILNMWHTIALEAEEMMADPYLAHTVDLHEAQVRIAIKGRDKHILVLNHLNKKLSAFPRFVLGEPDNHVIDAFFKHVVSNRSPAMGHRLLVHFMEALRSRLILSLNFDDLLERAYRAAGIEPSVFEVHYSASLPPHSLLDPTCTIIKLHGGKYGLRADLTLDRQPTDEDRKQFGGYLGNCDPPRDGTPHLAPIRNVLFVAGVSGRDRRVLSLIDGVLARNDHIKKDEEKFQVFWCCFTDDDELAVQEAFGKYCQNGQIEDTPERCIFAVRASHLGLLFWEVYQRVTRCLPPNGLDFPSAWQLPTPPILREDEYERLLQLHGKLWESNPAGPITAWLNGRDNDMRGGGAEELSSDEDRRPILRIIPEDANFSVRAPVAGIIESAGTPPPTATSLSSAEMHLSTGITALGWHLFHKLNGAKRCIWIDSEDLLDKGDLPERMLQIAASQVGQVYRRPTIGAMKNSSGAQSLDYGENTFIGELKGFLECSGKSWVLFVNLRGPLGYYASPFRKLGKWKEYLWNYEPYQIDAGSENAAIDRIYSFLTQLGEQLPHCLSIVILDKPRNISSSRISPRCIKTLEATVDQEKVKFWKSTIQTSDEVMSLLLHGSTKTVRLVRTLLLMEQARHQTALVLRSVLGPDMVAHRNQWEDAWKSVSNDIGNLVARKILRRKPGGFLWMHWKVRERLFPFLFSLPHASEEESTCAQLHLGLADWYMTFFHAASDQLAVFQAVYHRCRCAEIALREACLAHREDDCLTYLVMYRSAICQAGNHIDEVKGRILASGHYADARRCLKEFVDTFLCEAVDEHRKAANRENAPSLFRAIQQPSKEVIRNLTLLMKVKMKAHLLRVAIERDMGESAEVFKQLRSFDDWRKTWKATRPDVWAVYERCWTEEAFLFSRLMHLEKAILCISNRAYSKAVVVLREVAASPHISFPLSSVLKATMPSEIWNILKKWCSKQKDFKHEARRIVFYVLRRRAEVGILQAEARIASEMNGEGVFPDCEDLIGKSENLYLAATMIGRFVMETDDEHFRLERSRVHSVQAGVLAIRDDQSGVQRQINEARGALQRLPEADRHLARWVVELRRVYCAIMQLERLDALTRYGREICRPPMDIGVPTEGIKAHLFKAETLLDDIDRILLVIEEGLASNRKSLWWWMTLCRYKTVSYYYRELCRTWRLGHFSHEHVRPGEISMMGSDRDDAFAMCELLENVCRRTKYDAFQLARIAQPICKVYLLVGARKTVARSHGWDEDGTQDALKKGLKAVSVRLGTVLGNVTRDVKATFQIRNNIPFTANDAKICTPDQDIKVFCQHVLSEITAICG